MKYGECKCPHREWTSIEYILFTVIAGLFGYILYLALIGKL